METFNLQPQTGRENNYNNINVYSTSTSSSVICSPLSSPLSTIGTPQTECSMDQHISIPHESSSSDYNILQNYVKTFVP